MDALALVFLVLPVVVALAVLGHAFAVKGRSEPLSRVVVSGGEVVVDVDAPWWLTMSKRRTAPLGSVTGARVVTAGTRMPFTIRVLGTGLPGLQLGYFFRRGTGLVFVVRRPTREAVEIDVRDGQTKQWLVESATPDDVVAALSGVPS